MRECISCEEVLSSDYWALQGLDYRGHPEDTQITLYYCDNAKCPRYGLYTKIYKEIK